jgi:hypothetical protein
MKKPKKFVVAVEGRIISTHETLEAARKAETVAKLKVIDQKEPSAKRGRADRISWIGPVGMTMQKVTAAPQPPAFVPGNEQVH